MQSRRLLRLHRLWMWLQGAQIAMMSGFVTDQVDVAESSMDAEVPEGTASCLAASSCQQKNATTTARATVLRRATCLPTSPVMWRAVSPWRSPPIGLAFGVLRRRWHFAGSR